MSPFKAEDTEASQCRTVISHTRRDRPAADCAGPDSRGSTPGAESGCRFRVTPRTAVAGTLETEARLVDDVRAAVILHRKYWCLRVRENSELLMSKKTKTGTGQKTRPPGWKRLAYSLTAVLLALIVLEGVLSAIWVTLEVGSVFTAGPRVAELKEEYHCQYDAELGWVNRPQTRIEDFYGPGRTITINVSGVRGLDDLADRKQQPVFRAICLGDSFTLGYGVDDRQTFPFLLQQQAGPGYEIVNMGQGGYSVGQCYLWLKRLAPELQPDLVVCIFIVEDFRRLMTGRTANGFATPAFDVQNGKLTVSNIPVPEKLASGRLLLKQGAVLNAMKQNSALIRTMAQLAPESAPPTDEEAIFIGLHILRELAVFCRELDCPLHFALTPTLPELFDGASMTRYEGVSRLLKQFLSEEKIPFVDLRPAFLARSEDASQLFLEEAFHHYSSAGNSIVAGELHQWLGQTVPEFQ